MNIVANSDKYLLINANMFYDGRSTQYVNLVEFGTRCVDERTG